MKSRRKKDKSIVAPTGDSVEEFVDLLAEAVAEETEEQHKDTVEPFEQYALNLREKVHKDLANFRTRVVKGYHVLVDELTRDQEHGKSSSGSPADL